MLRVRRSWRPTSPVKMGGIPCPFFWVCCQVLPAPARGACWDEVALHLCKRYSKTARSKPHAQEIVLLWYTRLPPSLPPAPRLLLTPTPPRSGWRILPGSWPLARRPGRRHHHQVVAQGLPLAVGDRHRRRRRRPRARGWGGWKPTCRRSWPRLSCWGSSSAALTSASHAATTGVVWCGMVYGGYDNGARVWVSFGGVGPIVVVVVVGGGGGGDSSSGHLDTAIWTGSILYTHSIPYHTKLFCPK